MYPSLVSVKVVRVQVDDAGGASSAALVVPRRTRAMFVLAHGAGTTRTHESLVLLQESLESESIASLAFNFAYSEAGRRRPDPMPRLERAYRGAFAFARARARRRRWPLLAGGRSMGGRVATHLAAQGEAIDGLVLLGYPLHPADEPAKLRRAHLPQVRCPALFLSGTRDRLATPRLLTAAVKAMPDARLVWLEKADHGLDRAGWSRADTAAEVARIIGSFVSERFAA